MKRASGVLVNISSLYNDFGVGDFGPCAYRFADFLARSGQKYWQMLPVNPPTVDDPHCPYSAVSAYAGDPLFISPRHLYRDGLVEKKDISEIPEFPAGRIDYGIVSSYKRQLFEKAYEKFKSSRQSGFSQFCEDNSEWLDDFAMFSAFSEHFGTSLWNRWPIGIQNRDKHAMDKLHSQLSDKVDYHKFLQFVFFKQFNSLKEYCSDKGIRLIGDIPIYVAFDSTDVWANRRFFKLNRNNKPKYIAGTPPDAYSKTGQIWGNPVYDWKELKKTGFDWWMHRISHNLRMFDIVRIDHFRGLIAYWQVPASHKTAKNGRWVRTPKDTFFKEFFSRFSRDSIIVEDLGAITPAVVRFVNEHKLRGTRVMQFGLGSRDDSNIHRLKNHDVNSIVYTGTHDNNTLIGWFEDEIDEERKAALLKDIEADAADQDFHWRVLERTMRSKAELLIIPMQDILGLGSEARMNTPGTIENNWQWRMKAGQINSEIVRHLKTITLKTSR